MTYRVASTSSDSFIHFCPSYAEIYTYFSRIWASLAVLSQVWRFLQLGINPICTLVSSKSLFLVIHIIFCHFSSFLGSCVTKPLFFFRLLPVYLMFKDLVSVILFHFLCCCMCVNMSTIWILHASSHFLLPMPSDRPIAEFKGLSVSRCISSKANIPFVSCYDKVVYDRWLWNLIRSYSDHGVLDKYLSWVMLPCSFHLVFMIECLDYWFLSYDWVSFACTSALVNGGLAESEYLCDSFCV